MYLIRTNFFNKVKVGRVDNFFSSAFVMEYMLHHYDILLRYVFSLTGQKVFATQISTKGNQTF